jgi:hypothetical protein
VGGRGDEMAQTLYAHMNKTKILKKGKYRKMGLFLVEDTFVNIS